MAGIPLVSHSRVRRFISGSWVMHQDRLPASSMSPEKRSARDRTSTRSWAEEMVMLVVFISRV